MHLSRTNLYASDCLHEPWVDRYANLLGCPLLCFVARDARCRISYLLIPSIMQRKLELARFPCSFRVVFCRPSFGRRNEISCTYLLLLKKTKTLITCCSCFVFFVIVEWGFRSGSYEAKKQTSDKGAQLASDQATRTPFERMRRV